MPSPIPVKTIQPFIVKLLTYESDIMCQQFFDVVHLTIDLLPQPCFDVINGIK